MGDAVIQLSIVVRRREVLRYMGYPRSKSPSLRVQKTIDELWEEATRLVDARGAFVLVGRDEAESLGMPRPADRVALGVCTIGSELERLETDKSAEGDVLAALFLDAFGSAAAEEAAESLHARVCASALRQHRKAAQRVSPGYGTWNIDRQADLLAHLPTKQVGVVLTESSMMIPRKSVSFAVSIVLPEQATSKKRCVACDLMDCPYRRDEQDSRKQEKNPHE